MTPFGTLFIDRLDQLIDDNLDDPLFSIDTVCQELAISRSQLHRALKNQTTLSTSLYVRQRRLLKAKDLLLNTDLRVSEIGDRVGFSNHQNFSTYFTEGFSVSPSEFRKNHSYPQPVETPLAPDPAPVPTVTPEPLPARQAAPRRQWRMIGLGLLFVSGLGVVGWFWVRATNSPAPAKPATTSLAVLPFTNLGPANTNPACEGIMDDVHTSMAHLKNLRVIALSSSDQYRDTKKSIWQIGDELRVANVLKGSVLQTDDQVQIKVELIRTSDDIRVWGHTYRGAYRDLFSLTDRIVGEVAAQLKLPLGLSASEGLTQPKNLKGGPAARPNAARPNAARTQNPDAYNALLQGRQLLISRQNADMVAGITRFDRALALDSTVAEAHALKAVAYHLLVGSGKSTNEELNRLTEANALKAIRLDPTNSTAYGVLGSMYYTTYQWQASENAYRIALQHNPNDAQANYWYSLLLRTVGRSNEAVQYSTQAIALDPLHPIMLGGHIVNCIYAGRFDLARAGIETGRVLFDDSFSYQLAKAIYWMAQANYGRAVGAYQQAQLLNPDDKGQTPVILYCEAKRGNRPKAIRFLRELTATTPRADYERAVVYAGLNQADSSLYFLKKAADSGYLYRDTKAMPVFIPYHAHPVFRAVMRRFGLPEK